jgi:hypothetical protein
LFALATFGGIGYLIYNFESLLADAGWLDPKQKRSNVVQNKTHLPEEYRDEYVGSGLSCRFRRLEGTGTRSLPSASSIKSL